MSALMFVECTGYSAIIFRRTYPELSLPGGLLDRAADWLGGTNAKWNGNTHTWVFPSGASLTFGHMENEKDKFNYKSSEFQFIGFDELTSFTETQYLYLFSRLRRTKDSFIPLRIRSASNPGDIGHVFVKKRFVHPLVPVPTRRFIPSRLEDNPYLSGEEYAASLGNLDTFTKNQLLKGSWADFKGNRFFPSLWPRYDDLGDSWSLPFGITRRIVLKREAVIVIAVDWALGKKDDSDFTCFLVGALTYKDHGGSPTPGGYLLILQSINERIRQEENAKQLAKLCDYWQPQVVAGDSDMLAEGMMIDCRRYPQIPEIMALPLQNKPKLLRASAAIIRGENGRIFLPHEAPWLDDYCDELVSFTGVVKAEIDNQVDATGILGRVADRFIPPVRYIQEEPCLLLPGQNLWGN